MDVSKLVAESLAIEAQAAKEAGALGYMARVLVQATMPHKNTPGPEFQRSNGIFTYSIAGKYRSIGLRWSLGVSILVD